MTAREKSLGVIAVCLTVGAAWYHLAFSPLMETRVQQKAILERLESERRHVSDPGDLASRRQSLADRVDRLRAQGAGSAPVLVQQVAEAESRSGAAVENVLSLSLEERSQTQPSRSPRAESESDIQTIHHARWELTVSGSLHQVLGFGEALENLPAALRIESWQVDRDPDNEWGAGNLKGRYVINVLSADL